MPKVKPLPASRLRARLDPKSIPFETSDDIRRAAVADHPPQPRVLEALDLGLSIDDPGYHIFLCGEENMGRTYLIRNYLDPVARKAPPPPDAVYLYNFDDPDKPIVVTLPAGQGRVFKEELAEAVDRVRQEVPASFERESYLHRRREILEAYQKTRDKLMTEMESQATKKGFNLDMDDEGGVTIYPLVEGKVLTEEDYERLEPSLRSSLKAQGDALLHAVNDVLRRVSKEDQDFKEQEDALDREFVESVLAIHLDPLTKKWAKRCPDSGLGEHFEAMRKDLIKNLEQLAPRDGMSEPTSLAGLLGGGEQSNEDHFSRYEVHLFVDNAGAEGAPVVVEDHPTARNLLGSIERESEMGTLVTDFTLIKAGALHRANGGYLIIHVTDVMQYQSAWEGLLRSLRSGLARIEEVDEGQDQVKTKTLEPEPMPVNCKVVLIGDHDAYETLLAYDDRFPKLFKIKAHLQEHVWRKAPAVKSFVKSLVRVIDEAKLMPFDRAALAGVVDYASTLAEDQRKLSLKTPLVREIMLEADAMARSARKSIVDVESLARARRAKEYRANLYEEEFLEEYDRELIKVATHGSAVGRVNGLSVTWFGDYEFGLPHQIACTVGVGDEGVVDLEREADLGGPIHTKAMMILKSYLMGCFAQNKPLVFSGSLCFEQSYARVEGDSASAAELAALLSALAEVPIKRCYAFTGAVSQSGAILAVGGVTRKIQGFFQVCQRRGLNGRQGVLIPVDNRDHLMLDDNVVEAVEQGLFHIWPVSTIEQALELLTGMPTGNPLKRGGFTAGSLYARVDARLAELARLAKQTLPGGRRRAT